MAKMNIQDDDMTCSPSYNCAPTIYLSDDQCEALGITTPPAPGTVYMLRVKATAVSVTASVEESGEVAKEGDKPDVRLTLCLDDIEITSGGGKSAATMLYGE